MTDSYNLSRWIATATGCAAMALIGYSNVSKAREFGAAWESPAVLTAGGIALFSAVAIFVTARAQGRWPIALVLLVGVTLSEAQNGYNIFEGLLLGRDARLQLIRDHNAAIDLANASKAIADKAVVDLEGKVAAEATNGGCGADCKGLMVQLANAKADAQAKAHAIAALGAKRSERNIVAETLGVNELWVEAGPPLLTSLSLLAFAMGLLAFAHGTPAPLATLAASEPSLDDKTARILEEFRKRGGTLPSNQALAQALGVSEAEASKRATALVESGHIERQRDGKRATLRLVKAA